MHCSTQRASGSYFWEQSLVVVPMPDFTTSRLLSSTVDMPHA